MHHFITRFIQLNCLLAAFTTNTMAAQVIVNIVNQQGQLLENAVVFLESKKPLPTSTPNTIDVSQKQKTFHPFVSVIQTGSKVNFPNYDSVRHHVYSFSPAKTFEIKLYKGRPNAPIVFNQTGVVVLGCNIHDNMIAYVLVVDTPFFAKTEEDGNAIVKSLPNGDYTLKVWHPDLLEENQPFQQEITVSENLNTTVKLVTK